MVDGHLDENEIVAFFAGRLNADSVAQVEEHIDGCAACRTWLSAAAGGAPDILRPLIATTLVIGQRVADRYEIRRFVGAGGMGEVYEAFDLILSSRVALKTLRPDFTADPQYRERLRRELALARQVTHPHVSRVYDVGMHHTDEGDLPFFTLEFLTGETLAQRLSREGPLPFELAQRLFAQLAAGLQAAHEAGVLHRDLKSHNIFLRADREGALDAVLTDFGLARSAQEEGLNGRTLTPQGTPAYMAPEQALGGNVTAAADLYALGVVGFEMVTGTLPPRPLTPAARNERPSVAARTHRADLPEPWAQTLDALLQEKPEARPPSAAAALTPFRKSQTSPRRRALLGAAALVLLAGLMLVLVLGRAERGRGATTAAPERRRAIAVLSFQQSPASPETAWLSSAVTQMLSAELTGNGALRGVSPEVMATTDAALRAGAGAELSEQTLDALRKSTGAELILTGVVTAAPASTARALRVDARLYDATLGTLLGVVSETGSETELFAWIERTGTRLRALVVARVEGASEAKRAALSARAFIPASLPASRAYAEGTRALTQAEYVRARERFEETTRLEPTFAPAHAALAETLLRMGMREQARPSAERALAAGASLPDEQRRSIEALVYATRRDWTRAREAYRTLWTRYPDNVEHGLSLADTQISAGLFRDALATLGALHALPGPEREDPRIDLLEAAAELHLSDYGLAQRSAARAAARAELRGERLLIAKAHMAEADALTYLANREQALKLLDEAARIFDAAQDPIGVARARTIQGHVLRDRGNLDEALARYKEAEVIERQVGDEINLAASLASQAIIWRRRAQPDKALALNQAALALYERNSVRSSQLGQWNNIARTLEDLGRTAEAKRGYERVVALSTEIGEQAFRVRALGSLGLLAAAEGQLDQGVAAFENMLTTIDSMGEPALKGAALDRLIELLLAQGKLKDAQRRLAERERLSHDAKLEDAALVDASHARVALASGQLREATELGRRVIRHWEAHDSGGDEAEGYELLLEALLAAREGDVFKPELKRLQALADKLSSSTPAREIATRMEARYEAELGDARLGLREIDWLLKKTDLPLEHRFKLTLAKARANRRLGHGAVARATLEQLLTDARAKGFGAVVSDAQGMLPGL